MEASHIGLYDSDCCNNALVVNGVFQNFLLKVYDEGSFVNDEGKKYYSTVGAIELIIEFKAGMTMN